MICGVLAALRHVEHARPPGCPRTRGRSACTGCRCSCRGGSSGRRGARRRRAARSIRAAAAPHRHVVAPHQLLELVAVIRPSRRCARPGSAPAASPARRAGSPPPRPTPSRPPCPSCAGVAHGGRELRRARHADEADPARCRPSGSFGYQHSVGTSIAGGARGVEDRRALAHGDRPVVDRECDHRRHGGEGDTVKLTARAPTAQSRAAKSIARKSEFIYWRQSDGSFSTPVDGGIDTTVRSTHLAPRAATSIVALRWPCRRLPVSRDVPDHASRTARGAIECLTAGHWGPAECSTLPRRQYGSEEEGREEDGEEEGREEEEVSSLLMHRGRRGLPAPRISVDCARVILRDERHGRDLVPAGDEARLGRDPDLEFPFDPDDDIVSAVHARVRRDADGTWWLEDLGSTNGTWLNGRRLAAAERLHAGDRFTLGQRGPGVRGAASPASSRAPGAEAAIDPDVPLLRLRRVAGGADLRGARAARSSSAAPPPARSRCAPSPTPSSRSATRSSPSRPDGARHRHRPRRRKNGTYVNGRQVRGPTPLALGDRLMLGWQGPLLEVRALGAAVLPEGQGAAFQPERQPAKTLAGMVQEARGAAGAGARHGHRRVRPVARAPDGPRVVARLPRRRARLGMVVLVVGRGPRLPRPSARRGRRGRRPAPAPRSARSPPQLESEASARRHAEDEIARLRRELDAARAAQREPRRPRQPRAAGCATPRRAPAAGTRPPAADFSRVAADNQGAVGLVDRPLSAPTR